MFWIWMDKRYARRQRRRQQQQLPSITQGFVLPLQHNQKEIKKLKKPTVYNNST